MKKQIKRLHLSRETLRVLQGAEYRAVAGGLPAETINTSCECERMSDCGGESQDCYPPTACFGTCSCG